MNQVIQFPAVKSVKVENVWEIGRMSNKHQVTRVSFKDGRACTFQGSLSKKEAYYQAYLQRALDSGVSQAEAEQYALTKYPVPMKRGA